MKKWETPELNQLGINLTKEETCYCENGKDEEHITYHGGKPNRPGHDHRPDRPGKPCPPRPEPPKEDQDGSETPSLS